MPNTLFSETERIEGEGRWGDKGGEGLEDSEREGDERTAMEIKALAKSAKNRRLANGWREKD